MHMWGQFLPRPLVLYHHWSSLIWHEEEGFPSNVGLSKQKMTTSATLGLGKNYLHTSNDVDDKFIYDDQVWTQNFKLEGGRSIRK